MCGGLKERRTTRWYCAVCRPIAQRAAMDRYKVAEANRRKDPEYARRAALSTHNASRKKRYGITRDVFEYMYQRQGRGCAICGRPRSGKRHLCVDHDHKTGRVRGLLCARCNSFLGWLELHGDAAEKYLADAVKGGVLQLVLATGYSLDTPGDHAKSDRHGARVCRWCRAASSEKSGAGVRVPQHPIAGRGAPAGAGEGGGR